VFSVDLLCLTTTLFWKDSGLMVDEQIVELSIEIRFLIGNEPSPGLRARFPGPGFGMDVGSIFAFPGGVITSRERLCEIHFDVHGE